LDAERAWLKKNGARRGDGLRDTLCESSDESKSAKSAGAFDHTFQGWSGDLLV
jgi:hypothetical protein